LAVGVVELVVAEHPQEAEERDGAEHERGGDQDDADVQRPGPRRSAFSATVSELSDMAIAAISGVTRPASASGTKSRL
jgi:hypothetical protein